MQHLFVCLPSPFRGFSCWEKGCVWLGAWGNLWGAIFLEQEFPAVLHGLKSNICLSMSLACKEP